MKAAAAAVVGLVAAQGPAPRWTMVALPSDGLGHHAAAWDRLNVSRFGAHLALDSRLWNALLQQAHRPAVVLCTLAAQGGEPAAMCLLVYRGRGVWDSFLPAVAPTGPVMIDQVSMVEDLMRDLRPRARQINLRGVDPEVCRLDPQPQHRVSVHLQGLVVRIDAGTAAASGPGQAQVSSGPLAPWAEPGPPLRPAVQFRALQSVPEQSVPELEAALQRYLDLGAADGAAHVATAVLRAFAKTGQAVVLEAYEGDRLLASQPCLQSASDCWLLLPFCPASAAGAPVPGTGLQERMLRWAAMHRGFASLTLYGPLPFAQPPAAFVCRRSRDLTFYAPGFAAGARGGWGPFKAALSGPLKGPGTEDLRIEQLTLAALWPEDASALLNATASSTVQAMPEWFRNLGHSVYARHPGTQLCLVRNAWGVVAALPVVVERSWAGNTLTFLSNYYTALFVPALAPGVAASTLARAVQELARLHSPLAVVRLEPMDPLADHFHLLQQALELAGFYTHRYYRFGNWYLPTAGSYADFLKRRTAGLRSTLKRMGKRCEESGGRVEILTDEADLQRGLDAYWKVYNNSWKVDEPYPEFINGLARWCARQGMLRLGILSLHEAPVAAQIWLVHEGRAEIFKVAYDEAHKAVSPGSVLTAALLERVIDGDQVREVDFLAGDDAYKRTWMSHRRERWGLVAFTPLRIKGALGLVRMSGARLVRRIRGDKPASAAEHPAGA